MYFTLVLLHILGACIWAGGHIALVTAVLPRALRQRNPKIIADFERGYEKIGMPALLVQVVTGLWLISLRLPDPASWVDMKNPQTHLLMTKVLLLLATLLLAIHAKVRVLPRLDEKLGLFAAHAVAVTILSILFVTVGVLFRTGGVI